MMPRWIVAAGAALLLAGCNTSYNYFEDEKDPAAPVDSGAFAYILGMAGASKGPQIEYKARAPLAMPPSRELPPPVSSEPNKLAAAGAVDWPNDPDEDERQRMIRKRAIAETGESPAPDSTQSGGARLSPEEIQAGRLEGGGLDRSKGGGLIDGQTSDSQSFRLSPRELAKKFLPDNSEDEILTADGKAKSREYLIEPPDEYRQPAETAELPDPGDIENSSWFNERLFGKPDYRAEQYKK
jgi:hypothetical protein